MSAFHRLDDHARSVAVVAAALLAVSGLSACSGHDAGAPSAGPRTPSSNASTAPTPTGPASPSGRLSAHLARWRLPAARSREIALRTDSGVLVAGGLSAAQVSTASVWLLSTATGQAKALAPLAAGVHDATGVVVNGKPLVIAGGNTSTVSTVQELSPTSTRVIGHLPQPRSDLVAATLGTKAYVLGGFDGVTSLSPVLQTSDGRRFVQVANLRDSVRYPAAAAIGDRLLVFGGEINGVVTDKVQQVDPSSGRTQIVGHLPLPLAHESAFVLDGSVWLVGGRSGSVLQKRIWRWDDQRHRAVPAGRLPYGVADAATVVVGPAAYLLGGETPQPTDRVLVLRPQ